MLDANSFADSPLRRYDGRSKHQTAAMSSTGGSSSAATLSAASSRRAKRSTAAVTLLPITPQHEIVPGAIDVDHELARVVYLAPLTCTAAEKYFARTNGALGQSSEKDDSLEGGMQAVQHPGQGRHLQGQQSPCPSPADRLPDKLLAKHDGRKSQRRAEQTKLTGARVSVFDPNGSLDDMDAETRHQLSPAKQRPRPGRPEDEQIEQLKRHARSIPTTDDEKAEFRRTMKKYQQLQIEFRAGVLRDHTCPIGFNMEAAWNNKLLQERHHLWVRSHDERMDANRARKAEEAERQEQKMLESTAAFRAQMRVLREVRLRLTRESQLILPTIVLSAVTQNWLTRLQQHWRQEQLAKRLRGIIQFWRKQRASRNVHAHAAHLLVNWLQKSVAVKSVAFRVFRGIRNFVRRVKTIQRLWKVKQAKRLRWYLMLERLWREQETLLVDQANEEYERQHAKSEHKPAKGKKRSTSKTATTQRTNAHWLTYLSADIRMATIKEYVRDQEKAFTRLFRQQEEDLFPQLVQTLRDEHPNKARSYIKAVACGYALLGRVYIALSQFPGAVDEVTTVEHVVAIPRNAPLRDLILKARDCSPPDPTGARFGI